MSELFLPLICAVLPVMVTGSAVDRILVGDFTALMQLLVDNAWVEIQSNPYHLIIEAGFLLVIAYFLLQPAYKPHRKDELTEEEIDTLIDEWTPEPLFTPASSSSLEGKAFPPLIQRVAENSMVRLESVDEACLNLASYNFLGFSGDKTLIPPIKEALQKYGVGSCGPRGFYGTIDAHLKLEKDICEFYGTDETIIYSYGHATPASVVPCFLKRGDIIVCDDGISQALASGIQLSRSIVKYFRHNDMDDLRNVLERQRQKDLQGSGKKSQAQLTRRFIMVEGLYRDSGDIAKLDQIVQMKEEYKYRVLLEDSLAVGVLGATGRGTPEHFNIDMSKIDIYTGAMAYALGSVGGFCTGSAMVVDHQRLASGGYCFSASLPPFLAVAASEALKILSSEASSKKSRISALRATTAIIRKELLAHPCAVAALDRSSPSKSVLFTVSNRDPSPIFVLRVPPHHAARLSRSALEGLLQSVVDKVRTESDPAFPDHPHLAVTRAAYTIDQHPLPEPAIRVNANCLLDSASLTMGIRFLASTLAAAVSSVKKDP